jgi:hypothetical protein
MDREALWRLVVDAKYNRTRGGWCFEEVMGTFGVGVGNILEGSGISPPLLSDLRWGLGLKLVFGMIFDVGIDR